MKQSSFKALKKSSLKDGSIKKAHEENEILQNKIFVIENLLQKRETQILMLENEFQSNNPANLSKSMEFNNPTINSINLHNEIQSYKLAYKNLNDELEKGLNKNKIQETEKSVSSNQEINEKLENQKSKALSLKNKITDLEKEDKYELLKIIEGPSDFRMKRKEEPIKNPQNDVALNDSSESEQSVKLCREVAKAIEKSHQKNKKLVPTLDFSKIKLPK